MRTLFIIPLVLMSLVSFPSWGLTMDDLVIRAGFYCEKFTATPFTDEVDEGLYRGSLRNGKREGSWELYYRSGMLRSKGEFKNDELEGSWESYWDLGQLRMKGDSKNGKREGSWETYKSDGTVDEEGTGTFKNGVKVSD